MKNFSAISICLTFEIKKYFSIGSKPALSHNCKEPFGTEEINISYEDLIQAKEYIENYKITTRWQTL